MKHTILGAALTGLLLMGLPGISNAGEGAGTGISDEQVKRAKESAQRTTTDKDWAGKVELLKGTVVDFDRGVEEEGERFMCTAALRIKDTDTGRVVEGQPVKVLSWQGFTQRPVGWGDVKLEMCAILGKARNNGQSVIVAVKRDQTPGGRYFISVEAVAFDLFE